MYTLLIFIYIFNIYLCFWYLFTFFIFVYIFNIHLHCWYLFTFLIFIFFHFWYLFTFLIYIYIFHTYLHFLYLFIFLKFIYIFDIYFTFFLIKRKYLPSQNNVTSESCSVSYKLWNAFKMLDSNLDHFSRYFSVPMLFRLNRISLPSTMEKVALLSL